MNIYLIYQAYINQILSFHLQYFLQKIQLLDQKSKSQKLLMDETKQLCNIVEFQNLQLCEIEKEKEKLNDSSDESQNQTNKQLNKNKQSVSNNYNLQYFTNFDKIDLYVRQILQPKFMNVNLYIQQIVKQTEKYKKKHIQINSCIHDIYSTLSISDISNISSMQNTQSVQQSQWHEYKKKFIQCSELYYKNQIQKIQLKLLQSKAFTKCETFTSQILILKIIPTKNYQIVEIQLQLSCYKTKILILNQIQQSHLHKCCQVMTNGTYGNVYFIQFEYQNYAVKCIRYKNKQVTSHSQIQQKINQFYDTLKQFFMLKLFSQLQIGPKVKKYMGFDMISTRGCIQFCTEICQKRDFLQNSQKSSLKNCMITMHCLKIVHLDIKPSNFMFSKTYNKTVFIDFGTCRVIDQPIGLKSLTNFAGTAGYCSDEMFKILGKQKNYVDLYYNDLRGYMKTVSTIKNSDCIISSFETDVQAVKNMKMLLNLLKSYFYLQDRQNIQKCWRIFNIRHFQQIDQIQIKIMDFFTSLKFNNVSRIFYFQKVSGQIKIMPQFKSLRNKINTNRGAYNWNNSPKSKRQFQVQHNFYKCLLLKNHTSNFLHRQISYILNNKDITANYIQDMLFQKSQQKFSMNNLIMLSLILVNVCCVNKNQYQISLKKKIQACQKIIQVISTSFCQVSSHLKLIFKCEHKQLQSLARFFQFFVIQIWKFIPFQFKQDCLKNSLSTLCLLGYPIYLLNAKRFLINKFIQQQQFDNKILLFWKCNLIIKDIDLTNANQYTQDFLYQFNQQQRYNMEINEIQLFNSKNQLLEMKTCQFTQLNKNIYKQLYLKNNLVQIEQIQKYYIKLDIIKWDSSLSITQDKFHEWKKYIYTYLGIHQFQFYCSYTIKYYKIQISKYFDLYNLQDEIIWSIALSSAYRFNKIKQIQELFQLIDSNINQRINIRFFIHYRIVVAFKNNDFNLLSQIISLILKQIHLPLFKTINLLNKCLDVIQKMIGFNKQSVKSDKLILDKYLSIIQPLIYKAVQIVQQISNYPCQQDKDKLQNKQIQKRDNSQNKQYQKKVIQSKELQFGLTQVSSIIINICQIYNVSDLIILIGSSKIKKTDYKFIANPNLFIKSEYSKQKFDQYAHKKQSLKQKLSKLIDKIKNHKHIRLIINKNITVRNSFTLFNLFNAITTNDFLYFPHLVQQQFVGFNYLWLKQYNPEAMPCLFIITQYIKLKIYQNQSIKNHIAILLWQALIQFQAVEIYLQEFIINAVLKAFASTHNNFSSIQSLFLVLVNRITNQVNAMNLYNALKLFFHSSFQIKPLSQQLYIQQKQQQVYQKNQLVEWKIQNLIYYLSDNLTKKLTHESSYMSLIYFFCLSNQNITSKIKNKFLAFIYKSLPNINIYIKNIILQQIYGHTKELFRFLKQISLLLQIQKKSPKDNPKQILQKLISKGKISYSHIKNYFYYFNKHYKNSPKFSQTLQQIVNKRLQYKQFYLNGCNIPYNIKMIYKTKITKFHLIKQNYH